MKQNKWKNGSSSVLLGVFMSIFAFLAILLVLEYHEYSFTQTKVQMITDVVADGGAVAGNTLGGVDTNEINQTVNYLINANLFDDIDINPTVNVKKEVDEYGQETGNFLLYAHLIAERTAFFPQYNDLDERITLTSDALIRIEPLVSSSGYITQSFAQAPSANVPFETTSAGNRNPAFVTWFIRYYLNPEGNTLYSTNNALFVYDYLVCMGLNIQSQNISATNDTLIDYFETSSSWVEVSDVINARDAANKGKPAIAIFETTDRQDIWVLVPQNSVDGASIISIARGGFDAQNYISLDTLEFLNKGTLRYFISE